MSTHKIPAPTRAPGPGEVYIAFEVKLEGGRVKYAGPIDEELAKQMLALLGTRLFPGAEQAQASAA